MILNWENSIKKINSNKTKHLLVENELKKLQTFDSSYFRGKVYFEEDGPQHCLVFQPMYKYFKGVPSVGNGNYIYFWKYKGLSDENVASPTTTDYSSNLKLSDFFSKTRVEFSGSCLKRNKITYNHGKIVNIYNVYEISKNYDISNYPTLEKVLFRAITLTRNVDIDRYKYSG